MVNGGQYATRDGQTVELVKCAVDWGSQPTVSHLVLLHKIKGNSVPSNHKVHTVYSDCMHACMMPYICGKMHDFLVNMKLEIYWMFCNKQVFVGKSIIICNSNRQYTKGILSDLYHKYSVALIAH